MSGVRTLNDVEWQSTCHGRLAEVRTASGWLRLVEDGDGFTVTRFGADLMPVGEPEWITASETEAALSR